jgi:hypothetical protein
MVAPRIDDSTQSRWPGHPEIGRGHRAPAIATVARWVTIGNHCTLQVRKKRCSWYAFRKAESMSLAR